MTQIEALQAIRGFGIAAEFSMPWTGSIVLGGNVHVLVLCLRRGFAAWFVDECNDAMQTGPTTENPVLAALQAVAFASAAGVKFG